MLLLGAFLLVWGLTRHAADCQDQVILDGHLLRRRARKAKAEAGGLDGWLGALMAMLRLDFFSRLADLWQSLRAATSLKH